MWKPSPFEHKGALGCGAVVALVAAVLTFVVGRVGGLEAEALLEASLPTIRFLCSSVMTASATTLALLLTLLSLSASADQKLKPEFYRAIQTVALLAVIAFIGASVLLLTLAVPFGEEVEVPATWYVVLYYATTLMAALVVGVLVSVLLSLYQIVGDLISTFWLDGPSSLLAHEEDEAGDGQQESEVREGASGGAQQEPAGAERPE